MKYLLFILAFIAYCTFCSSCRSVYPNVMFKDVQDSSLVTIISKLEEDYKIQIGDELNIKIYNSEGANLIDPRMPQLQEGVSTWAQVQTLQNFYFLVSNDGKVDLPMIGKINVIGHNEKSLTELLKKLYSSYFQSPFVVLRVENRRAIVFKGSVGQLISLNRTPTNIFEVLAKSGGFTRDYHADKIKILRGNIHNPKVFNVDLSSMASISNSELMIQSNDIIYLEERRRPAFYALSEIAPIVSLPLSIIASTISTIFLIVSLSK